MFLQLVYNIIANSYFYMQCYYCTLMHVGISNGSGFLIYSVIHDALPQLLIPFVCRLYSLPVMDNGAYMHACVTSQHKTCIEK